MTRGNVGYALLDAQVVAGLADAPITGTMTHARLLEDTAALAGALRHLGAREGSPVVLDLAEDLDAVVAALAVARLGGVVTTQLHPDAPVLLVSEGSSMALAGRPRLVRGVAVAEPDLDWDVLLRAGRTDPAACEPVDLRAAYSPTRSVAEQIAVLEGSAPPYDTAELRRLLQA